MKSVAAIAALLALAPAAFADPGYYDVTGVASDDTLNVRAEPDAASADIGDLPFDAKGIEVIATDASGDWGRIVWEEGNGWIATRFLAEAALPTLTGTALPAGLQCSGTEPFWSIRYAETGAVYSDVMGTALSLGYGGAAVAEGFATFPVALSHAGAGSGTLSIVSTAICSDGMSDRDYPYTVALVLQTESGQRFLSGCCWLPLDAGTN
ncbi:peptide-binding protein [Psychromarinibacter sp. S121]|uniref:peptide-binding protein n=1 Tax=Psychromarinibacter sp. S121 TaxID=3415127 RepID=UPI003C7C542A